MKLIKKLIAGAVICTCSTLAVASNDVLNLRFSHWVPPRHPIASQSIAEWTKRVEADSQGTLRFSVFPSGQLGKPKDHYDLISGGIADVGWINPGMSPGRWPIFNLSQTPMLVSDAIAGSAALSEWYARYAGKEMPDVKFCYAQMNGPLNIFTKDHLVTLPEDLAGLKLRPSSLGEALYLRALGAATVQGTYPDARELLDRGIVDGTTGTYGSMLQFGVEKPIHYHLDIPFSVVTYVVIINQQRYDAMKPVQQAAIDKNCGPEDGRRFARHVNEFEAAGARKVHTEMREGRVFVEPTPELIKAWQSHVPAVVTHWAQAVQARGYDSQKVYSDFTDTLEKYGALVK